MMWTPDVSAVRPALESARGQNSDAGGDCRAQGEARTAHVQQHAMPRIDDVDAGAFHQSEFAEPTRFILAAAQRHDSCRRTRNAIAQTTRSRCLGGAGSERSYDWQSDGSHRSV